MRTLLPTNSARRNRRIDPSRNIGFIRKRFIRKILAVALMGASLALFLCAAGGVSYGDSARLTSPKVTAYAHYYPTFGTPNDTLVTDGADGYVLVSVSGWTYAMTKVARVFRFSERVISRTRAAATSQPPIWEQFQSVCHDTLPWLISCSLVFTK
jgi:hypothetical protein